MITENQIPREMWLSGKLNEHRWAHLSSPSPCLPPADQFSSWLIAKPGMDTFDATPACSVIDVLRSNEALRIKFKYFLFLSLWSWCHKPCLLADASLQVGDQPPSVSAAKLPAVIFTPEIWGQVVLRSQSWCNLLHHEPLQITKQGQFSSRKQAGTAWKF